MSAKLLLIDNYDSFTFNLAQAFQVLGAEVVVVRNDQLSLEEADAISPTHLCISPGPGRPEDAGISMDMIRHFAGRIPILGVCLGHQSLGQAFGAKIVRAPEPMHGKVSEIIHFSSGVFADIKSPFRSTRYHSLIVERESLPDCFDVTAETDNGLIMGIEHKSHSLHGVQFHPESIATDYGHKLLKNFLDIC